jgi:hypothetical protein
MLAALLALVLSLDGDQICTVCFEAVSQLKIMDKPAPVCPDFETRDETDECISLLNANFTTIAEQARLGRSTLQICGALSKCPTEPSKWAETKRALLERWNHNVPEALQINADDDNLLDTAYQTLRKHIDLDKAKETAKKVVKGTVQTGKKLLEAGGEFVGKVGQSDEWKSLKKNVKDAFSDLKKMWNDGEKDPETNDI